MPTIAEAVRNDSLTLGPSRDVGPVAWKAGGDTIGTFRDGVLTAGNTRYRARTEKSQVILIDEATDSRVLSFTSLAHGPATIRAANRRLRLVREHLVPVLFRITEDINGPTVLRILKLGGKRLRFRSTEHTGTLSDHDLTMIVLAASMHLLRLGVPAHGISEHRTAPVR